MFEATEGGGARVDGVVGVMPTSLLSDGDLAGAHPAQTGAHPAQTGYIAATVAEDVRAVGPGARVCVPPEGPQILPYVRTAGG